MVHRNHKLTDMVICVGININHILVIKHLLNTRAYCMLLLKVFKAVFGKNKANGSAKL